MAVNDQLKIIDNKIKANQTQYDLDRLAAKISGYSSLILSWFKETWIFDWGRFRIQTECSWTSQIWLVSIG